LNLIFEFLGILKYRVFNNATDKYELITESRKYHVTSEGCVFLTEMTKQTKSNLSTTSLAYVNCLRGGGVRYEYTFNGTGIFRFTI